MGGCRGGIFGCRLCGFGFVFEGEGVADVDSSVAVGDGEFLFGEGFLDAVVEEGVDEGGFFGVEFGEFDTADAVFGGDGEGEDDFTFGFGEVVECFEVAVFDERSHALDDVSDAFSIDGAGGLVVVFCGDGDAGSGVVGAGVGHDLVFARLRLGVWLGGCGLGSRLWGVLGCGLGCCWWLGLGDGDGGDDGVFEDVFGGVDLGWSLGVVAGGQHDEGGDGQGDDGGACEHVALGGLVDRHQSPLYWGSRRSMKAEKASLRSLDSRKAAFQVAT